ncbi:MAG: GNAT family N-acetyltransferase, partial [Rhodanobacteraceae bacterium]
MLKTSNAKVSATPFPEIEGDHWIEKLNDGSPVLIRPIRPEDRERERDFIDRLSPEARYFRFLGTMQEPSPALLDQLVNVGDPDAVAFVALAHEDGTLREVGVSRYSAAGDDKHCECAVTVADNWRHRGLAVTLMHHLMNMARRNGFRQMFSLDDAANQPMRELAHYLGFHRASDPDDATQV